MQRTSRSSVHPVDPWPRTQSPLLIPGSCRLRAARAPAVRRAVWPAEHAEKLKRNLLPPPECRITLESIELEKRAIIYGQKSKCFSVQPVLRCLPGCSPVKTTPVIVGFHCVAAREYITTLPNQNNLNRAACVLISLHLATESNLKKSEIVRGIQKKSVNLWERAEAHLACSCPAQCAWTPSATLTFCGLFWKAFKNKVSFKKKKQTQLLISNQWIQSFKRQKLMFQQSILVG